MISVKLWKLLANSFWQTVSIRIIIVDRHVYWPTAVVDKRLPQGHGRRVHCMCLFLGRQLRLRTVTDGYDNDCQYSWSHRTSSFIGHLMMSFPNTPETLFSANVPLKADQTKPKWPADRFVDNLERSKMCSMWLTKSANNNNNMKKKKRPKLSWPWWHA